MVCVPCTLGLSVPELGVGGPMSTSSTFVSKAVEALPKVGLGCFVEDTLPSCFVKIALGVWLGAYIVLGSSLTPAWFLQFFPFFPLRRTLPSASQSAFHRPLHPLLDKEEG